MRSTFASLANKTISQTDLDKFKSLSEQITAITSDIKKASLLAAKVRNEGRSLLHNAEVAAKPVSGIGGPTM